MPNLQPNIKDGKEASKSFFSGKSANDYLKLFGHFLYIQWDGLNFFGFDDTKLARLKPGAKPPTVLFKFTSVRWNIITFGSLIGAIFILVYELNKFGSIRSKEISLI